MSKLGLRQSLANRKQQREKAGFASSPKVLGVVFFLGILVNLFLYLSGGGSSNASPVSAIMNVQTGIALSNQQVSAGGSTSSRRTSSESAKVPGKYKPISCPDFLLEVRRDPYKDPNKGVLYGKQIETDPKFWISLHNEQFDKTRWEIMKSGKYYEFALTDAFIEVLKASPPGSRVIDIGGNIGYFTLLSAANGPVTVDTFEPNDKNRIRVCEALGLNHWQGEFDKNFVGDPKEVSLVNLHFYGIGKEEGVFGFIENANPGGGMFSEQKSDAEAGGLQVIKLDNFAKDRGWFTSRPDIALLKVDVEGLEAFVIEGAEELLKLKVIRNVFMEVTATNDEKKNMNTKALKILFDAGYKLHKSGGWQGPKRPNEWPHDATLIDNILNQAAKEGSGLLNLWLKL
jgi:FkbM family methyltransferase